MHEGSRRVMRAAGWIGAAAAAVVIVTGIWLSRYYRPVAPVVGRTPTDLRWIHDLHIVGSLALAVAALALMAAMLHTAVESIAHRLPAMAALLLVGAVALAFWTARDLRWTQLALTSVRIGRDVRGVFFAATAHNVRFVVVGAHELTARNYRRRVIAHVFASTALVAICAVLVIATRAAAAGRRRPPAPTEPPAGPG